MKSILLSIVILLLSVAIVPAQNWYTEQTQQGWAPNYGLGQSNGTGFGSAPYQSVAPQGEWQNEQEDVYYNWEDNGAYDNPMQPYPTDTYSYGVPRNERPVSCGPWDNPRAREGC